MKNQEAVTLAKNVRLSRLALLVATLIWGSSFVMMKNAVEILPPNYLLTIRFGVSCLILSIIFHKRLRRINGRYLRQTAIIGLCLFLAYSFQTYGIQRTTPGKNAFLTAVYVIIVPFLYWLTAGKKPAGKNIIGAIVCFGGIGLISLTTQLRISLGDSYTLIGGFFFAAHMVAVAMFSKDKDPILVTIVQFAYCAVFFGVTAFFRETWPVEVDPGGYFGLFYLTVFCTAIALLLQNYSQKYLNPSVASLLFSLEAIFGVSFSVVLYGEKLTPRLVLGFALVFLAILIAEGSFTIKKGSPRPALRNRSILKTEE